MHDVTEAGRTAPVPTRTVCRLQRVIPITVDPPRPRLDSSRSLAAPATRRAIGPCLRARSARSRSPSYAYQPRGQRRAGREPSTASLQVIETIAVDTPLSRSNSNASTAPGARVRSAKPATSSSDDTAAPLGQRLAERGNGLPRLARPDDARSRRLQSARPITPRHGLHGRHTPDPRAVQIESSEPDRQHSDATPYRGSSSARAYDGARREFARKRRVVSRAEPREVAVVASPGMARRSRGSQPRSDTREATSARAGRARARGTVLDVAAVEPAGVGPPPAAPPPASVVLQPRGPQAPNDARPRAAFPDWPTSARRTLARRTAASPEPPHRSLTSRTRAHGRLPAPSAYPHLPGDPRVRRRRPLAAVFTLGVRSRSRRRLRR